MIHSEMVIFVVRQQLSFWRALDACIRRQEVYLHLFPVAVRSLTLQSALYFPFTTSDMIDYVASVL